MQAMFFHALGPDGFQRVHYTQWGDPGATEVVACAHGLTRNARDFDYLARALAPDYRVVCIDFPGRGGSDWLQSKSAYNVEFYVGVSVVWLAAVGGRRVHWIGTSMGALVGMGLAAQARVPLASMLVNDVGPEIPAEAMQRIAGYVGVDYRFADLAALEAHLRLVHAPFGALDDAQWAHLARHSQRRRDDGSYGFHYDPGIAAAFAEAAREGAVDLWPVWRRSTLPTLVLHGADSDVLPAAVAERMRQTHPACRLEHIADVGHAPALMDAAQIGLVREWLRNPIQ